MIIGLACLGGAAFFGLKTHDLLAHGLHAQGQVVDIKEKLETQTRHQQGYGDITSQHMMYFPIVKFEDSQHHSVQFTHQVGSSSPSHQKGDTVEVDLVEGNLTFNPLKPSQMEEPPKLEEPQNEIMMV